MHKVVYYCDATGAKLSEEEVKASLLLASQQNGILTPGVYAGKVHKHLPLYWEEYSKLVTEHLQRVAKTIENHRKKFFQEHI